MSKKSARFYREFRCPECGEKVTAPKGRKTPIGHIKTMYCWKCREERNFVQIGEK